MLKKCEDCKHAGRDCIPFLMTLSPEDLLAWCKIRKSVLHISSEEIADKSCVPRGTIDRLLSSKGTDCRFSTMQPIICLLSGCKKEDLDCSKETHSSETLNEKLKAKYEIIHHLEEENMRQAEYINQLQVMAKEDIERAKEEEKISIDYMKRKEKRLVITIYILGALLAISLIIIIAALVIDKNNQNVGFFWLRGILGKRSNIG